MYLRAAKEDAEQAGIDTEGMANSVSSLRDTIKSLTNNKVDIMSDEAGTQFKSTYQIMKEIANVYDDLSDVDQAALLEKISGKRQANATAALISQFQTAEDVVKSAQKATGSADAENAKFLDSIEGKMQQFQATFQSLSTSILDSELVKGTVDFGSGILSFLNTLISKLGTLPGLIAPITNLLLNMSGKSILGSADKNANGLSKFFSVFKNGGLGKSISNWINAPKNIANKDYDILDKYIKGKQNLKGAAFENAMTGASVQAREFAKTLDAAGEQYDVLNSKAKAFTQAQIAANTVGARIKTTLVGIGSALGSMAAITAAVWAISKGYEWVRNQIMTAQDAAEVTQNVVSKYQNTREEIDKNISTVEDLKSRFEELSRGVSDSGKNISLATDQYQEYQDIVSQLVDINPALIQGYNDEAQAIIDKNNAIEQTIELLKKQRMHEANETVYGGKSENKGHKSNYEAAVIDYRNEYSDAKRGVDEASRNMTTFIQDAYKGVENSNEDAAAKFRATLERISGQTFDDFKQQQAANGMAVDSIPFTDFIAAHASSLNPSSDVFQQTLSSLVKADAISLDLVKSGDSISRSWEAANNTLEGAGENLKSMLQASLEADESYYNLNNDQKGLLDQYIKGIDGSTFGNIGSNTQIPLEYTKAMLRVISTTEEGNEAVKEFQNLTSQSGNLTAKQYDQQASNLVNKLQTAVSKALPSGMEDFKIDFSEVLGISDFQKNTQDLQNTINTTMQNGFNDIFPDGKFIDVDSEKLAKFQDLYDQYVAVKKDMAANGITKTDVNRQVYGNVDLSKRDSITWTKENLTHYKSELQSLLKDEAKDWDSFVTGMVGKTSTVIGGSGEYGKNSIPIAYTPLLQTNNGLQPLSQGTIDSYLNDIVERASRMDGNIYKNIMRLDVKGAQVDGKRISNIIAGVGETAERVGRIMHFSGDNGAFGLAAQDIQNACEEAGASTQDFWAYFASGSQDAAKALAGVSKDLKDAFNFDLESLTNNQLGAFSTILSNAGDNLMTYLTQLQAISDSGHLPEFLDEFNKKMQSQSDALRTVSQDLTDYSQKMEANAVNGAETHESMVEVYDSLSKAVKKGQINTEDARTQMELLIGKVVDLKEAKKWIKENQGFFLTGNDEKKVGQDLTGGFNTLHKKYNALSADNKKLADSLMTVDWQHGSIQVAQHDVSQLAYLFGMSTTSLQQFFDLVSTYSNPAKTDIASVGDGVKQLNSATASATSKTKEGLKETTTAWDLLTGAQKRSLESMTKNTALDPSAMSTAQIEHYTDAWNSMAIAMKNDFSDTGIDTFFKSLGSGVAKVGELSNGVKTIDITNISALASKLSEIKNIKISEADVRNILANFNGKTLANGDKYNITVNGEQAVSETSKVQQCTQDLVALFAQKYDLNINELPAMMSVENIKSYANSRFSNMSYPVNFTLGSMPSVPGLNIGGGGNTKNDNKKGKGKKGQGFTGHVGKMTQYASGGNAVGGKTLVGELGPEQWISRDGKHSKIVGLHGMEVIDTKPGDAIVPANLTAGLIRGGMRQAYDGADSTGSLDNLKYGSDGKYANWTGSSSKKSKKSNKSSKSSKVTDAQKEALDKLKEEVQELLDKLEHKIYIAEEEREDPYKIVAYYKQIQQEAHKAAERFRAKGAAEDSEWIRDMQKKWYEARDSIIDTMKDMYDKITSEHENAVKLAERSLDRLLDTDKLERSFTRAQRKIFNSAKLSQNILNGVAKKGNPLAGIFSGVADSFETKTVDTIFSSIDGDAIESTLNGIIDHYREAQKNLHKEAQYYRGMGYSDLSDEVADLSDQWWEYEDAVKDVKQKVIDYLSDIVDAASESVDTIQDVLDTFKKAAEEYSTNGGFISVDTFQEISKLGVEYMGYLKDENGLLTINEEAINRVIKAKTDQMALESASAYVERLRMALQENDVVSLNNLLNATADLTEVQWGSVYAQLAMLDLTEEGYAQAVKNVDAYRSVLANVKAGVGIDFDDTKDSVDALFKYVEDMIRDEIDQQVDALEELKDKYSEIIDKKKESLQLSKDEADYQDEVADKVKEMAKLQEKINALSLDDSRESIAKRKDLEEQLADLQKELGETQANEAYDRQTDNLDKLQEAYEKEKDAEIKKLQDSISSEEKLYQMARKRIQDGWATLYDDLIEYNTRAGSDINAKVTQAWQDAQKAMEKYNATYLEVYDRLGENGSHSSSNGSSSNTIGNSNKYGTSDAEAADIKYIVGQMKKNSDKWSKNMTKDQKDELNKKNWDWSKQLNSKYDLGVYYDGSTGIWYDKDHDNIYSKYLGKLHSGGVVGDFSTLRQDEMIATLQKGEIVLDKPKQQSLDSILKVMSAITSGLSASALPDLSKAAQMPVSGVNREVVTIPRENVTNVTFGDTIIKGADGDTVKQHEAVSRRMVNDIIEVLKIKK